MTKPRTKASNKYNKQSTIQLNIRLNKTTDADVIAYIQTVENKREYIINLINADMKR